LALIINDTNLRAQAEFAFEKWLAEEGAQEFIYILLIKIIL
jgi:hypothetical protein